ncbi:hypothetical protein OM280_09515 [Escherichia albertii]|uniref:O-antigen polymerase n=1 Tax=Escherichia albertii TaxID=208962 RepID=A0A5A4U809_ESCAL|nr:hypothetical protein [Escherichia albertii]MCZ8779457.1 hypothetical protein [Escherichia albertii]BBM62578.1 O-antigen polymerase [Escherichia albertii]
MYDNKTIPKAYTKERECSSLFLVMILICMIINDLPLQQYWGTLGASPMWGVSLFIFMLTIIRGRFILNLDITSKYFLYFYILTFTVSFLQCIYYAISKGSVEDEFGRLIFGKLVFASTYYIVYFFTIYAAIFVVRKITSSALKFCIVSASILLLFLLLVEYFSPNALSLFHKSMDGYGFGFRQRLLSPEPSMAAFTLNIFLLISITLIKSKITKLFMGVALVVGNILIGSKASLLLILMSGIIVFYLNMNLTQKIKSLFILIPVSVAVVYVFINTVLPALIVDVDKFTSVSTRIITALWAMLSLIYYPLGEGYGTYGSYFIGPLNSAVQLAEELLPFTLNVSEVNKMLMTGESLAAKSGILFSVIQNGFISLIFFFAIYRNAFRKVCVTKLSGYNKIMMRIILWYSLLSIMFAVNIEVVYAFLLPFIVIEHYAYKLYASL